ncbi:hypothetical protein L9F63_000114, partial [Diploptera punctata]
VLYSISLLGPFTDMIVIYYIWLFNYLIHYLTRLSTRMFPFLSVYCLHSSLPPFALSFTQFPDLLIFFVLFYNIKCFMFPVC